METTFARILILALLIAALAAFAPHPSAASSVASSAVPSDADSSYEKALDLKILGLIANAPGRFELDRAPTRLEGAVMLVRLLGREKAAKEGGFAHPFTDVPAWADCYVGYLYRNKLTYGVGNGRFGASEPLSAAQFITFVLRSAGYGDNNDFPRKNAIDKAVEIGLLTRPEAARLKNAKFLRGDTFAISYNALLVRLKDSNLTLLDKLANEDKIIFKPTARALGLYTSDLVPELGEPSRYGKPETRDGFVVENGEDMFRLLRKTLYLFEESASMDIGGYRGNAADDSRRAFGRALDAVKEITGIENIVDWWEYRQTGGSSVKITIKYVCGKSELERKKSKAAAALNKARRVVANIIDGGMTDYDKEKALHDYIIENTDYDYENYPDGAPGGDSFDEYGCLVLGTAVCEGYSEAMKLLCDLAGLECVVVAGKTQINGRWESHAWNIIKIDGSYYHTDVTNDDPVTGDGTKMTAYYYFNLPDSDMARNNYWDRSAYPACTSRKDSYYYRNNLVAADRSEFNRAVAAALSRQEPVIEYMVLDYSKTAYSDISKTVFGSGSVTGYKMLVHDDLGIIRIFDITYSQGISG